MQKSSDDCLSMSDDIGKVSQVDCLNLCHYLQGDIYARVHHIMDHGNLLRDIDEACCRALHWLLRNENHDHHHWMMTVYVSPTVKPRGAAYVTAGHNVDGTKVLKDGFCMAMQHGRHWHRSFEKIKDKDAMEWATERLFMRYPFQADGKHILQAQAINLSNIAKLSKAIVGRAETFRNKT